SGDFLKMFEHVVASISYQLVRLEGIVFEQVFWLIAFKQRAGNDLNLFAPCDIGFRRLPIADAVQIWLDRGSAWQWCTDQRRRNCRERPSVEEDVGGGQDSRGRSKGIATGR